jgi:hypothetical protein
MNKQMNEAGRFISLQAQNKKKSHALDGACGGS